MHSGLLPAKMIITLLHNISGCLQYARGLKYLLLAMYRMCIFQIFSVHISCIESRKIVHRVEDLAEQPRGYSAVQSEPEPKFRLKQCARRIGSLWLRMNVVLCKE